jgi:hypothetical protein
MVRFLPRQMYRNWLGCIASMSAFREHNPCGGVCLPGSTDGSV